MNANPEVRFLTVAEAAERLRATKWSVGRRCRSGELRATKPFGTWLIPEDAIEDVLRAGANSAAGEDVS